LNQKNKKVSFYSLEFKEKYKDNFFNKDKFIDLINYISDKDLDDKIIQKDSNNNDKALILENCEKITNNTYRVLLISCKYNFSPNYISSLDATERPSDKELYEGEKEKTHAVIKIKKNETLVILENNSTGVSITQFVYYFSEMLSESSIFGEKSNKIKVIYSIIPSDDFMDALDNTKRIRVAELFTTKEFLGSEFKNSLDREDKYMREEIQLKLKAKRSEGLLVRNAKKLYEKFSSDDSNIKRIRIYGKDQNDNKIKIDTKVFEKTEYVTTIINANGTINSDSIFDSLEKIIEAYSENW
jgi:hypothetical protein